jgi:hypothetical protein
MSMHEGLPVAGYQKQSSERVDLVNANKEIEERCLRVLDSLVGKVDPRWLAIGRTQMEQAWMAVNRAVFQPARATLPEDKSNA